jgi:hypothetical protein
MTTYYIYQGTGKALLKLGLLECRAHEGQYYITDLGRETLAALASESEAGK